MVPLCTFPNSTGKTCGSTALRGRDYCYFHNPARRVSGRRYPTTRPAYRWYALYRKIPQLRPEQASPVWNQLAEAALNHEISQEWLFKILKRYNLRVMELGAQMRQADAAGGGVQRLTS
ncbi:MAG TPA: hypothetical protein VE178_15695 [Silvibacterium sp.]|nr:hypothetical protein [Silvibacterium sp.]